MSCNKEVQKRESALRVGSVRVPGNGHRQSISGKVYLRCCLRRKRAASGLWAVMAGKLIATGESEGGNGMLSDRKRILHPAAKLTSRLIRGGGYVAAGYPAEAYNYIEPGLDLNKRIIRNRMHNRCAWATNRQMTGEGIFYGDLVVFDEALRWKPGAVGVYRIDGELTLRREVRREGYMELAALDPLIKPVRIEPDELLLRLGVVTHVIKKFSVYRNNYAGLPEDADGYIESGMDYAKYLVGEGRWAVTFYLWADGESMAGDGIDSGDLLIVDNTEPVHDDSILVFIVDGQFTLKRVIQREGYNELLSSNPAVPPIRIKKGVELERWGVLKGVVKELYHGNDKLVHTLGRE